MHEDTPMAVPCGRDRGRAAPAGFSLTELLVVIGIIALLIALLMPALSHIRENAKQLQCQVNLRNVFTAGQIHTVDHSGYLPTAGWHPNLESDEVTAIALGDSRWFRYIYYTEGGVRRPVPVTVALASCLGRKFRTDSRANLEEDMQDPNLRKLFHCPSQEAPMLGLSQVSDNWQGPREWSSYVFNEALLGRRDHISDKCPMGKLTMVRHPSTVMLAMDGRPRHPDTISLIVIFDVTKQDSVYDFQQTVLNNPVVHGTETLDYLRHRYRINVVFLDGHVESVPMTDDALKTIGLSKGIYD